MGLYFHVPKSLKEEGPVLHPKKSYIINSLSILSASQCLRTGLTACFSGIQCFKDIWDKWPFSLLNSFEFSFNHYRWPSKLPFDISNLENILKTTKTSFPVIPTLFEANLLENFRFTLSYLYSLIKYLRLKSQCIFLSCGVSSPGISDA